MFRYTQDSFLDHLEKDHKISPIKRYLQEVVYGGNDGIISTFVVVSGFTAAKNSSFLGSPLSVVTLLLFGFANLFADAVSMAFGNFLSVRADQDVYRDLAKGEWKKIHKVPEMEKAETEFILLEKGFTRQQARELTKMFSENRPFWLNFMMREELGIDYSLDEDPVLTALVTFISFVCFGFLPLFPFLIWTDIGNSFLVSIGSTSLALVIIGLLRAYVSRIMWWKSVLEVTLVGLAAASVAYLVGSLF